MMHDPDSGKAPSRGTGGLTSATTLPILPPDTDVRAAALAYAAKGWPVFPCWESGEHAKAPRTPNGFKDATTDAKQVERWWDNFPDSLIGCAPPSGVIVLDVDSPEALTDLEAINGGPLPATLTAHTGRAGGGWHYYYLTDTEGLSQSGVHWPDGKKVQGVDVRLRDKGYLIVPPSPHPDTGTLYEWEHWVPPVPLPEPLVDACGPVAPRTEQPDRVRRSDLPQSLEGLLHTVRNALEGERNDLLFWASCCMAERDQNDLTTDWEGLTAAATTAGLPQREINKTINSARKKVQKESPDGIPAKTEAGELEVTRERTGKLIVKLTPAEGVRIEPPTWLLQEVIPLKVITLIAGNAGQGKSTLALHWAARATRGELPGEYLGEPVTVAISATEDDKSIQVARLQAAGADLSRVLFLDIAEDREDALEQPLQFPRDQAAIFEALAKTGARLWIIDPIAALVTGDTHKAADVRRALDPVHVLAQKSGISVLGVHHFNKSGGRARGRLGESHAFHDVTRAHIPLVLDEETGHRVYTLEKGNYTRNVGRSFMFDLEETEVTGSDGHTFHVARVKELGDSPVSVDQINARSEMGDDETRNEAQQFILDYLRDTGGSAPSKAVLAAGRSEGYNNQQLKDARRRMKNPEVSTTRYGFGKGSGTIWALEEAVGDPLNQPIDGIGGVDSNVTNPATYATYAGDVPPTDPQATT